MGCGQLYPELAAGVTKRQEARCMRKGGELGSLEEGLSGAIAPVGSQKQLPCFVWVWARGSREGNGHRPPGPLMWVRESGCPHARATRGTVGRLSPELGSRGFYLPSIKLNGSSQF